jgi:arginyl-tRNA synthetase
MKHKGISTYININTMICIRDKLQTIFKNAITHIGHSLDNVSIGQPSMKFKQYSTSVAFMLKKQANLPPKEIADKLVLVIKDIMIGKLDVLKNGKIVIYINKIWMKEQASLLLKNGVVLNVQSDEKTIVDFSSPNIAKDMHVGHLRSTIIGDSICNLYDLVGMENQRISHIGDFGLPFGMLIAHCLDSWPCDLDGLAHDLNSSPSDLNGLVNMQDYKLDIKNLQNFYKTAKKRFDQEDDFKKRAYHNVTQLQQKKEPITSVWKKICAISRQNYQGVYDMLNIRLTEKGESFYGDIIPIVLQEIKDKGLLLVEEGRHVVYTENKERFMTVVKSDGGYTYETTDLAALYYRLIIEKVDRIIYVVDSGQSLHFETLITMARDLGWLTTQNVQHVKFGVVLGPDGKKFKTRSGDTVKLSDLLNQSVEKAKEILTDTKNDKEISKEVLKHKEESFLKKDKIAKTVGISAVKYADLSADRTKDYSFSFNRMLNFKGNTAVYLLYNYTRICSIIKRSKVKDLTSDFDLKDEDLVLHVLRFPDIILNTLESLKFHDLCKYLYELSSLFSTFITNNRCLEIDNGVVISANKDRILLCELTRKVMAKGFSVLGIVPLEQM